MIERKLIRQNKTFKRFINSSSPIQDVSSLLPGLIQVSDSLMSGLQQTLHNCFSSQEIFPFHFLLDVALWSLFLAMSSLMLLELPVPSSTSSTMIPPILSSPAPSAWSRFSSNSPFLLHSIPPDPNLFQEAEAAVNVSSPPRLLHTGPGDGRGEVGVWLSPFP